MTDAELPLVVPGLVNQPHHRRVGGDVDAALGVLLRHQIHGRGGGQMLLEGVHRLVHQRHAISKKEHLLGPVAAHQHIAQSNDRARLARAGRHHHQRLPITVFLKRLADAPDGPRLVVALHNGGVDLRAGQRLPSGPAQDEQLEFVPLEETLHGARRIGGVIPDPVLVTVCVEDDGTLPKLFLQAIGVELRLLLARMGITLGPLRLHDGERFAIGGPENVVDKALSGLIGHAIDFVFAILWLIQRPTGFAQEQVNKGVAGLGFRVIVSIGLGQIRRLGQGHFRT